MIENLKIFMKKKYDYDLNEFKVCTPEKSTQKLQLLPLYVFIVVLILYLVQVVGLLDEIFGLPVLAIIAVLIAMWQYTIILKRKPQELVVTPKYIIQTFGKKTFNVVVFDEIRKFKITEKEGILIADKKAEVIISPVCYKNDLEPIVDILEAKGKTFDKSREFMKRPISIKIVKDRIIIKEVEIEESSTEKLVGKYYEEYKMLTPGFIRDIIFLNSVVDKAYEDDENLVLVLNKIEVKEGHPENTGFDSIIASDCIAIFEKVKVTQITTKNSRDRESKEEELPKEIASICESVEKGVIANWKYRKKAIDLHFAAGVNIVKTSFEYKEVIIGWKNFK